MKLADFSHILSLVQTLARLGSWVPLRPGVEKLTLVVGPGGEEVALLRYAPGAWVPRHRHRGTETIWMVEGSQRDEYGLCQAGETRVNLPGTVHGVSSETGCLLMIHWERPVEFL